MSRAPSGLGVYLLLIFQLLLLYQHPVRGQNIGAPVEGETVYVRVDAFLEEPHACTSEEKISHWSDALFCARCIGPCIVLA